MSKILVLYKSKYGATKKYVNMIEEELECDVFEADHYEKAEIEKYNCVIFAGGIYASGIAGIPVLRKNFEDLKNKKIAVFCVGASPYDEKAFEEIKIHNLKKDLKNIPVFYGRGAWDESKMSFKDRTLCKLLQKVIAKKDPDSCEPWMKALMCAAGEKYDWTDKKELEPLFNYIKMMEGC